MGWRPGRGRATAIGLAERRLGEVARQWRCSPGPAVPMQDPVPVPEPVGGWDAIADGPDADQPVRSTTWSRSAVRGLAVIVALAVTVAGYWAWSGRPRAVAVAPTVVAVGTPLPTPAPDPTPTPMPGPAQVSDLSATVDGAQYASAHAPTAAAVPLVVVHVTGLVARPGLVRLPLGARVADAVAEAGGVTRRRAADTVNLARILVDGEQVVVGVPGAPGSVGSAGPAAGSPPGTPLGSTLTPVDLNTATAGALEALPGIGPVIAARIVDWRTANGAFRSVEELGEVSGIGDAILSQVRGLVRV
jgi:competence protein ComEA